MFFGRHTYQPGRVARVLVWVGLVRRVAHADFLKAYGGMHACMHKIAHTV